MGMLKSDQTISGKNYLNRCIACGTVNEVLAVDFRCTTCGELVEVEFPDWPSEASSDARRLKTLWRDRRSSNQPLDASGVWRFREVLPELNSWSHAITLREGNTPLYDLS